MNLDLPKARAFHWSGGRLRLLDQRALPMRQVWKTCRTWTQVAEGIRTMVVRGAPAIGCVAAYGVVLAARAKSYKTRADLHRALAVASQGLVAARPTAVNLKWAVQRMGTIWNAGAPGRGSLGDSLPSNLTSPALRRADAPGPTIQALEQEAIRIETEDRESNIRMGQFGAALLPDSAVVMTHCNTGSLATAGLGTAFGVIWTAFKQGKLRKAIASETRPYLQGARLTAWELKQEKIPFELMTDNMAAHIMHSERVDAIIVGADRIAANGDTANKIGTYGLAVLAKHHDIPFYVAAPRSTIDLDTPDGSQIPIEERSAEEVTLVLGKRITPEGVRVRHPAFDVTPAELIEAIITDHGVARPSYEASLRALFNPEPLAVL